MKHHSWCCDKRNPCSEMIEKCEKGFPCMESRLFVDFVMGAGSYLKGEKGIMMEEKHIRGVQKGKLAFLTAVSPNTKEEERYFIGILDIEEIKNEHDVQGNKESSIVINPKIKLQFWNYFKNKDGSKKWSSGRFRYVSDKLVLMVLEDLKKEYDKLEGFEKEKSNLNIFIERYKKYVEGE